MATEHSAPVIYLDVNVLLDAMYSRQASAVSLLQRIRDNQWSAMTSPFSILEMLEARQADKWAEKQLQQGLTFFQIQRRLGTRRTGPQRLNRRELDLVYVDLRDHLTPVYEVVTFPQPTQGLLNRAEDISAATNIEATDTFHLATALEFDCNLLVTSDRDFAKLARDYIIAVTPEGFDKGLQEFYQLGH